MDPQVGMNTGAVHGATTDQPGGPAAVDSKSTPTTWAVTRPQGKLSSGHTVSDLTAVSLHPQVKPQGKVVMGQKQHPTGNLGGNWGQAKGHLEGTGHSTGTLGANWGQTKGHLEGTGHKEQEEEPDLEISALFDNPANHAEGAETHSSTRIGGAQQSGTPHAEDLPEGEEGQHEEVNPGGHPGGAPQAETPRLRDTTGAPLELVDGHDVEEAHQNVDATIERTDREQRPPEVKLSKWEQAKMMLKAAWKSEIVRAVVFTAVAVLAFAAIVGLAVAIPFSGGGSAIALAALLVVITLVFQGAVIGAVTSLGPQAPPQDPNKPASFQDSFKKLQDEMRDKESDPNYRPSFSDFYANPSVKEVLDGKNKDIKLKPEAQARVDNLKRLQTDLTAYEAKIKEREQERDVFVRLKQRDIDENNQEIGEIKQGIESRKAESRELGARLKDLKQELQRNPGEAANLTPQIEALKAQLKANTDKNKEEGAKIGPIEIANEKLEGDIERIKAQHQGIIDPMKQRAKEDKIAIDTEFKQFLKDFDTEEKLIATKAPEAETAPPEANPATT